MDDLLPPRIVRIARQLSVTPVELIEPILADLPYHRILDLLATQYGAGSHYGTALQSAISNSKAWAALRGQDLARMAALWVALNRLSLLSEGQLVMATPADSELRPRHANDSSSSMQNWPRLASLLENDLIRAFSRVTLQKEKFRDRGTKLYAVTQYLPEPETSTSSQHPRTVAELRAKGWQPNDCIEIIPRLAEAQKLLNEAKASELHRLADLYEQFPTYLKTPLAPQTPRKNIAHVPRQLRFYARKPDRTVWSFRYAHPILVPYDWCFQLFDAVNQELEYSADLQKTRDGIQSIQTLEDTLPRLNSTKGQEVQEKKHTIPSSASELEWLESFMRIIEQMEGQFPDLAASIKERTADRSLDTTSDNPPDTVKRPKTPSNVLLEPSDFHHFITNSRYQDVAVQLRYDFELSKKASRGATELPSLVALYMPPFSARESRNVAYSIWPTLDLGMRQLLFEQMIETIKKKLSETPDSAAPDGLPDELHQYVPSGTRQRTCYVCRMVLDKPHQKLASMCIPCGEFNLAERALSLPENLSLIGKTAVVTGGRVNLGFQTALRLLRCGAAVIVSSRYPEDALSRYRLESDFEDWAERLRIVGADFRTAADAFALVQSIRRILHEEGWVLDFLINNAAQTLTDPVEKEQHAIEREKSLLGDTSDDGQKVVVRQGYSARVRGGAGGLLGGMAGGEPGRISAPSAPDNTFLAGPMSELQISGTDKETPASSSWVQSLSDIPYEDIITAHSVNTFVSLILIRELLPLMRKGGHIVNVSSREGLFESNQRSSAKKSKHVHTNMSKAGLNMITETEAPTAWKQGVAMNTVDPGYMSAAPEYENAYNGERPIGWEDGAGRVLWPIARVERKTFPSPPIWGRFLKHYGAIRVDTRLGRG
ncbi:hypothetical protein CORC01_03096 [Colletotrichum orchidophilum]|uniref:Oxidoreductase n=1 Tax=Colletotrichum orchidophilum TaxID=1209926 RepID=A0A1G4BJW4_9PEZI|nr:uncharacterized protein CORC01_03096 [Colletotrichum orchidophilum]OHF01606.1 hypothetical protein CORC01_03096 [Colletotrichum orchidophilum]